MFSKFFILRPIFAAVCSLIIVIAGILSSFFLPVSQYPTITPVQILVSTTYPGADAKTVSEAIASPIEAQINGVENMLYMTSTSSNTGQVRISVYFSLDTDPDIAQVLVQNRVNLALPKLPTTVQRYGVNVSKQSSTTLMIVSFYDKSGRYSPDYVTTYVNTYILDAIKRINGAGEARIFGVSDQAMRIWLNPDRMASLGITTTDIQEAIASQNALVGAGQIGQEPSSTHPQLTLPVVTQAPYTKPEEYEQIILRADPQGGAIVRLGDVARAEVGRKQYVDGNFLNGSAATALAVYQQAGANGLEVSAAVRKELQRLKETMPDGIEYVIALDTTDFVRISIKEVMQTLIEAVVLVVLVVYLFLQNFRATLVCCTAIVVSLVGTFLGILAFGFSVNLLTLFAMVLSIGIVVDDAIVVVENIERNISEKHTTPIEATFQAMQEISGAVVATVLVLAAVFVPAAFLPGTTGQLYRQFALTIVISVSISGFVALTLTPAMSRVLFKRHKFSEGGFFGWFNRQFANLTKKYGRWIIRSLRNLPFSLGVFLMMMGSIAYFFSIIPTAFVPNEDQGYVLAQVVLPDAASLERTIIASRKLDEIFAKNPAVANRTVVNGFSLLDSQNQSNMSTLFVTLQDFDQRYRSLATPKKENAKAVLLSVYKEAQALESAKVIPIAPPAIPGIGTTGGFEFWIQNFGSADANQLYEVAMRFLDKARTSAVLSGLNTNFRASSMQLSAHVNRNRATLLGVKIADINNTLQAQFGSLQVSQYQQYSRTWDVILQSDDLYRQTPGDLTRLYTRSKSAEMVPLSALVTVDYSAGPALVPHFNGVPAAQITGSAAAGYSSGDAIKEMEAIAKEVLPAGYGYAWAGMAFQEVSSGSTSFYAFFFGILIVFLILSAQYESWSLPLIVLTAVPFGMIGALLAIYFRGLANDVYFQIGLLVLVGLAAKNAILIVEFAVELRKKGKGIIQAAVTAGKLRLRPIVMTSLTTICGAAPLYFASGAGANARHSIGTGIVGGMIGASTLALLYVPLFFFLLYSILKRVQRRKDA